MKRILLVIILFLFVSNLFGNEKIVGLKYKKKFPVMKFYLTDKNYNRDYGYYEVNLIADDVIDNTVEPYKDMVNPDLIKRYGISYSWWRWCIPWACVSGTFGGVFFGFFTGALVDSYYRPGQYQQEGYSKSYLQDNRNTFTAGVVLSSLLLTITFILVGLFAYNVANCIKIKKQILNVLNGEGISMTENEYIKVSFSVDLNYNTVSGNF